MPDKKINRQVMFIHAPAFVAEDSSGINNTWIYNRAPSGYLFQLIAVDISVAHNPTTATGIFALFDGHEYTHWNLFPGVESRETLTRLETDQYSSQAVRDLYGWECKEYTIAVRSLSASLGYKACVIVWYTLTKASREELLEYAIKHPKDEDAFKRALRGSTVESEEA